MVKILWTFRALFLKIRFKKFGLLSYIGRPTFMYGTNKMEIGRKVRIFPGLRIEAHGASANIIIGQNVGIGQNLHITAGGTLVIERNTTISGAAFITDIDHCYTEIGKSILEQPLIVSKTYIGENCFIGYGAAIQAGTVLGKQCIVGANSVVRGSFPDYCVIVGAPAKIVKKFNKNTNNWQKTNEKGEFIL